MGTIGVASARSLATYVKIGDQMPKLQEIKDTPDTAKVPTNETAICMVVHRTLQTIERNWTESWMKYMERLPKEAQGLFANAVRNAVAKSKNGQANKRLIEVTTSKSYMDWCLKNNYMFAADKV